MSTSADPAELGVLRDLPPSERAADPGMRALASHGEFRVFWMNTAATVVGRSMVTATLAWLALDVTGSELKLAWVAAAQFVPTLFVSLLAGGLVDRVRKKALIVATSVMGGVVALTLAATYSLGALEYWHLIAASLAVGLILSFDFPGRQALLGDIVSAPLLFSGLALVSTTQQVGWFVGPVLVGGLGAQSGMAIVLVASGALNIAGAGLLTRMRTAVPRAIEREALFREIGAALIHVKDTELRFVFGAVAAIALFVMNYQIFITALAQRTLRLGPEGYGLLMAAMGLGALLGAAWAHRSSRNAPTVPRALRFAGLAGALTFGLTFATPSLVACMFLVSGVGAAWTLFQANALTIVQDLTPITMRGKVLSAYAFLNVGLTPAGYALAGFIAEKGGVPLAFAIDGGAAVVCCVALATMWRSQMAGGVRTATLS